MTNQPILWMGFNLFILFLLALDLGLIHKKPHKISIKESLLWTLVWIGLALIFSSVIYFFLGKQKALEFLTAYIVEKSLSIDNIFVFLLIFSTLQVPERYRHKTLFWGVIGALVLRGLMIVTGLSLLHHFHFVTYVLGATLILAGLKMVFQKTEDIQSQPLFKWVLNRLPPHSEKQDGKFIQRINGKLNLTHLGVTLVLIELSDLVFALDSIPAVLSVSTDLFIVYTSNVFAIMGLRSLFFTLDSLIKYFRYLPYGLAIILIFIGVRMFIPESMQISTANELLAIIVVFSGSILASAVSAK